MSGLVRAGVVLAVLGLSLATLWAVAFGAVAAGEADCGDVAPSYSLESVDPPTATVRLHDGCNDHVLARPVVVGLAAAAVGGVGGGVGLAARARRDGRG